MNEQAETEKQNNTDSTIEVPIFQSKGNEPESKYEGSPEVGKTEEKQLLSPNIFTKCMNGLNNMLGRGTGVAEDEIIPANGNISPSSAENFGIKSFSDGKQSSDTNLQHVKEVDPEVIVGNQFYGTFNKKISSTILPNAKQNQKYKYDLVIKELTENIAKIEILAVYLAADTDTGLSAELQDDNISIYGIPKTTGSVTLGIKYKMGEPNDNSKVLEANFPPFTIYADPQTLWMNKEPDHSAKYGTKNEDSTAISGINGKKLVLVSKRGRSHAHEGKFREDSFASAWLTEQQWLIVAVSDGAGSAEFSREGARIACSTFVDKLKDKLSNLDTNKIINDLPEQEREESLKHMLFTTANHAAREIEKEANENNVSLKKYSATLLGYIAKKFGDEWLFVSVGIGDGAIAVLDNEGVIHLLNEPDGGEYVGQTRFLTTPEVWMEGYSKRTFYTRVSDFKVCFSMTDGVSDPKFETDNNLKDSEKWEAFWQELVNEKRINDDLETTKDQLLDWLNFWSRGNHDDRTLTVLWGD